MRACMHGVGGLMLFHSPPPPAPHTHVHTPPPSVEEYSGRLDVERRNIDQLTKQIEAMQAKLIEKVTWWLPCEALRGSREQGRGERGGGGSWPRARNANRGWGREERLCSPSILVCVRVRFWDSTPSPPPLGLPPWLIAVFLPYHHHHCSVGIWAVSMLLRRTN